MVSILKNGCLRIHALHDQTAVYKNWLFLIFSFLFPPFFRLSLSLSPFALLGLGYFFLGLHFGLEFFHSLGGIDQFLLTGIKRMAIGTDLHFQFFLSGTGGKTIAADASNLNIFVILGMNILFHSDQLLLFNYRKILT